MISEAAKAAFRQRASLPATFNDFSPGTVKRFRSFAAAIGGSDPFAEPAPSSPVKAAAPISSPGPAKAPPAAPAKTTAADLEFEKVRAAALARQKAERQARAEEDAAVALILAAAANLRA